VNVGPRPLAAVRENRRKQKNTPKVVQRFAVPRASAMMNIATPVPSCTHQITTHHLPVSLNISATLREDTGSPNWYCAKNLSI
jgi:hypothetical protein